MDCDVSASIAAKTFNNIMQELESAEDTLTMLGNSISFIRREVDTRRVRISKIQRENQILTDTAMSLAERGTQSSINVKDLECQKKFLNQRIEETKQQLVTKRNELVKLKKRSADVAHFIESLELFTSKRSLLVDPPVDLDPAVSNRQLVVEETFEDLSGIDLSEFALSQ